MKKFCRLGIHWFIIAIRIVNYLFGVGTCERSLPVRVLFTESSRIGMNKQLDDIHRASVSCCQVERKRLGALCVCRCSSFVVIQKKMHNINICILMRACHVQWNEASGLGMTFNRIWVSIIDISQGFNVSMMRNCNVKWQLMIGCIGHGGSSGICINNLFQCKRTSPAHAGQVKRMPSITIPPFCCFRPHLEKLFNEFQICIVETSEMETGFPTNSEALGSLWTFAYQSIDNISGAFTSNRHSNGKHAVLVLGTHRSWICFDQAFYNPKWGVIHESSN
mmetsp:Transcript_137/g.223  ORF Transcript_137/g.223 Transcript_137/m.223 type:complete len:278 (-) Transcript_137:250-1083(-)